MPKVPYDEIAEWYDEQMRAGLPIHRLALNTIMDVVAAGAGERILDLACGQGLVSRALARRNAKVTGVDSSARLIEIARKYEKQNPLGITYLTDDAHQLRGLPDESFDKAVCNMALMNIDDIVQAFQSVHRTLRPEGRFVFSIGHPCFQTPASKWLDEEDPQRVRREVRSYFKEEVWASPNSSSIRGRVPEHHRMLSTYLNALVHAGLRLERVVEPRARNAMARQKPGYAQVPAVLVAGCRK